MPTNEKKFLKRCRGVIHIGANSGQEREAYAELGLRVIWVEALPTVFAQLQENISAYPKQEAICALLTDKNNKTYTFYIANNDGASSSILDLKHHRDIWPDVYYIGEVKLTSSTLPSALLKGGLDFKDCDALVMDTQGSELLILQGAEKILGAFQFIQTEAAEFEAYANCATVESLTTFLASHGFELVYSEKFAQHPSLGGYYDVLYERSTDLNETL